MSESRDEHGNFAEGHTDGPEIGSDERVDPHMLSWRRTRIKVKEQYPNAWEKYAVEAQDDA